jgi:hypothetical protein
MMVRMSGRMPEHVGREPVPRRRGLHRLWLVALSYIFANGFAAGVAQP